MYTKLEGAAADHVTTAEVVAPAQPSLFFYNAYFRRLSSSRPRHFASAKSRSPPGQRDTSTCMNYPALYSAASNDFFVILFTLR